jgi:hypothetical protein
MHGDLTSLSHTLLWRGVKAQEQLYLILMFLFNFYSKSSFKWLNTLYPKCLLHIRNELIIQPVQSKRDEHRQSG